MEKSNIPVIDVAQDQQHIEMAIIALDQYSVGKRKMVVQTKTGNKWNDVEVEVFRIDHPTLGHYIPSKVLPMNGKLHLMYYTNPDLPDGVRPFEDGLCYAWMLTWTPLSTFRYPALSRVWIDQVVVGDRVVSLFIANSSTYESLLSVPEPKDLQGDLAIYKKSHRWV